MTATTVWQLAVTLAIGGCVLAFISEVMVTCLPKKGTAEYDEVITQQQKKVFIRCFWLGIILMLVSVPIFLYGYLTRIS